MTTEEQETGTERCDEVEETWREKNLGVTVRRVTRNGYEEQQELLKVYGSREEVYGTLDGSGRKETERQVKLAEFPPQVATEVLHGLAEAYGYNLEAK